MTGPESGEFNKFPTSRWGSTCALRFKKLPTGWEDSRSRALIGEWPETTLFPDAEPPKRATYGGRMARIRRFKPGSLLKRGARTKVWVARWWEDVIGAEGKPERIRRSEILGTVAETPTRRQAEQILADRLRGINSGDYRPQS